MAFLAGAKLKAQDLNDLILAAYMSADVTVNNTTTLTNATGLSLPLLASAVYAIDGWVHWTSNPTADFKLGWSVPGGAVGWWSLLGPPAAQVPIAGSERINYTDFGALTLASDLTVAGDDAFTGTVNISARLGGFVTTTNSGTLQLRFAQNTANASNTIMETGSWLRITRLD